LPRSPLKGMTIGRLWIEPMMGMAGDMFAGALLALGAPEDDVIAAMRTAASILGDAQIEIIDRAMDGGARAKRVAVSAAPRAPMPIAEAPGLLEQALRQTGVRGGYAGFAHRALAILCEVERTAHDVVGQDTTGEAASIGLTVVGTAHTPFTEKAPYQPPVESQSATDESFVEIKPEFAEALAGLDSFSHIFVLSYLERSPGYSMTVRPPWKDEDRRYGLFATRSPNRPSPIGLTRVRLQRIEGTRLFTSPLDLFDGTPILDVKPYVRSLDADPGDSFGNAEAGNDGWLAGSDHLESHRRGVPHTHPGGGLLHEAQDILVDVVGAASALQHLSVDLGCVTCLAPVRIGGGRTTSTSHGPLSVPAPATRAILERYEVPWAAGPVEAELLTPTGVAILAALSPAFASELPETRTALVAGLGLGERAFSPAFPNTLRLYLEVGPDSGQ
jgi:tRNA-Thr(GGU) m(6)t(6)A37 methyltransferase TsaA